jgi:hypothetical protein
MAQTPAAQPPPALEFRDVSGIVKDEKDDAVPGAVVLLKSPSGFCFTQLPITMAYLYLSR